MILVHSNEQASEINALNLLMKTFCILTQIGLLMSIF